MQIVEPSMPRVSSTRYAFFTTSVKRAPLRVFTTWSRDVDGWPTHVPLRMTRSGPQMTARVRELETLRRVDAANLMLAAGIGRPKLRRRNARRELARIGFRIPRPPEVADRHIVDERPVRVRIGPRPAEAGHHPRADALAVEPRTISRSSSAGSSTSGPDAPVEVTRRRGRPLFELDEHAALALGVRMPEHERIEPRRAQLQLHLEDDAMVAHARVAQLVR